MHTLKLKDWRWNLRLLPKWESSPCLESETIYPKKKNSLSLSLEFSKVKNDQDEGSRQKDGYTDISCTSKRVDTSNFICM
jgi:hypothetical protein